MLSKTHENAYRHVLIIESVSGKTVLISVYLQNCKCLTEIDKIILSGMK